jgi:cell division transport system permease protein
MFGRLSYFARETWVSLRRNVLMTTAGVITVAVSLCVLGGALLMTRLVDHGTQRWKDGVEFEVFMKVGATTPETKAVQRALDGDADISHYRYLSKQDAYTEFKRLFADQPQLVSTTSAADLPESFRVAPRKAELTKTVAARYSNLGGVESVETADKQVKDLLATSRWIRIGFLSIFAALLFASLFLIVNTIRLATFARRREIEVMKLVGASNWFVRVPFMLEGMVQGVVGALVGVAAVWGLRKVLTDAIPSATNTFWHGWYVGPSDAFQISVIVLLLGAGIGAIGAVVGLRRFLDV